MADIQISNLPTFTGNTTGAYLVMNNSANTETFKVNIVSGGSLDYDELTEIPGQMVWDATLLSAANSRFKVGGGLMINYTTSALPLVSGRVYANTIILEPGETLTEMMFAIPGFTTASTFNIALFNITSVETNNAIAYRVGTLQKVISSGLTISSSGDKKITGIDYTATGGTSPNNVYVVCLFQNGGCSVDRLAVNNLISHVMGGELNGGIYYRANILNISGLSSTSIVSDLSSYSIQHDTSPGWYFVYKTK
jgi:hypothetical protein